MKRTIKFYRTYDGKCYIEDFLEKQRDDLQIKILSVFKLIESLEIVPVKFLKKLTGTKLYEIRVEWKSDIYRFPCFFQKDQLVVITHGFQKKKMKTPMNEIEKAERYRKDYLRRNK